VLCDLQRKCWYAAVNQATTQKAVNVAQSHRALMPGTGKRQTQCSQESLAQAVQRTAAQSLLNMYYAGV